MNIKSTKSELRKQMLTKRKSLDYVDASQRSDRLCKDLEVFIREGYIIHCFLPLINDNEPDLRSFIESAIEAGSQVFTTDPEIRDVKYPESELAMNLLKQYQLADNTKFDLIIAPMLGFRGLHRLGFGGGFYDQFLVNQPQAKKIGVCFREFEIANLPIESHDQPLDKIIIA